jgi:hypothetical protein
MELVLLVLLLVCSTQILDTILHHNCVLLFSCFHNKILFEPTFYTLHVFVFGFYISCLNLELNLFFCHVLFMSLKIFVSWLFSYPWKFLWNITIQNIHKTNFKNILLKMVTLIFKHNTTKIKLRHCPLKSYNNKNNH